MTDTPATPADPYVMTADQIYALTPDQATAVLAAMDRVIHPPPSVVPQDAQDARQQLDLLSRNASWAENLFRGNVETRKQFDELVAKAAGGDDVGDAVAGIVEPALPLIETTAEGALPRRAVEATISGLRDAGPQRCQYRAGRKSAADQPRRIHERAGAQISASWHGRMAQQVAERGL